MHLRKATSSGILLAICISYVIIGKTSGYIDWKQCENDGCMDPEVELLLSSMQNAATAIRGNENGFMEAVRDVEHIISRKGYIYPPLTRIEPTEVGEKVDVELLPGRTVQRITRSVSPPLFEVPDFLTSSECEQLIERGKSKGLRLKKAPLGDSVSDNNQESTDQEGEQSIPVGQTAFLEMSDLSREFFKKLDERTAAVTELPLEIISRSDLPQIGLYHPGGNSHAHLDTTADDGTSTLPCCFQAPHCSKRTQTGLEYSQCCKKCIYMTVLMYLNDVDDGGETAFCLAEQSDQYKENFVQKILKAGEHLQLTAEECKATKVKVKPRRGTAIFWYNHFKDEKTGYLGPVDERTYHGGCGINQGTKWISGFTISAAPYDNRHLPSKYKRQ